MPERKGRKRKVSRERRRDGDATSAAATIDAPQPRAAQGPAKARGAKANDGPLPSTTARATGFLIAAVTLFVSILMIFQTVSGDASGIDGAARLIGGAFMVLLAIVVGTLSVAPAMVRDWFQRRR
jgi:hypothetical protein